VSEDRLRQILDTSLEIWQIGRNNPYASIIIAARKRVWPHWLRITRGSGEDIHYYASEGNEWNTIFIVIPTIKQEIEAYKRVSTGIMSALAEILLDFHVPPKLKVDTKEEREQFKQNFASTAVKTRGFVASRVRHTSLGLEYICKQILPERSRFLHGKINAFLRGFLTEHDTI
jgi:hypothetical protein